MAKPTYAFTELTELLYMANTIAEVRDVEWVFEDERFRYSEFKVRVFRDLVLERKLQLIHKVR